MINNAIKRIISVALAAALLFSCTLTASAAEKQDKEEVVYVRLSHDGRVDTIYVVNSFDLPVAGAITDTGTYAEVRNLTTTDPIFLTGNTVSVNAPKGKFYYEGVLEDREIPWDISVQYLLDGKPISGDRLAGQSGHLQIDLRIHQKDSANPVYGDNYAIQASLSLDSERCVNIVAEDATIANVGKNKQMSYIILPGKEGDFSITADVVDFEMDGISINGIPLSLNIDDPDTEEIKDKISELQDGAVELDDGAWELNDGAVELDDGATKLDDGVLTLEDGVAEMEDGVEDLQEGADDLRDGAHELLNGTKDLRDGVDELEAGVLRLASGAGTFREGLSMLVGQSATLTASSALVLQGLQMLETGIGDLDEEDLARMLEQAAQLQTGAQQYLDTLDALIDSYERQLQNSLSLGFSGGDELALLQNTLDLLQGLRDSYAEINEGVAGLTGVVLARGESLQTLITGIRELNEQYTILNSGLTIYTEGVGRLDASYGQLGDGVSELTSGVEDLSDGAKDLRSGARELYDGTYDLKDGVNQLTDGVAELREGATELRDGTLELKDGTLELLDGAVELLDGTTELRDKTADMDEEIDDRIDELLEEYRGSDFEVVSFVDSGSRVNSVQFVMLTESIAVDDAVEEPVVEAEPAPMTFWQRFRNLFSFLGN